MYIWFALQRKSRTPEARASFSIGNAEEAIQRWRGTGRGAENTELDFKISTLAHISL